jgi:hypothetical protein
VDNPKLYSTLCNRLSLNAALQPEDALLVCEWFLFTAGFCESNATRSGKSEIGLKWLRGSHRASTSSYEHSELNDCTCTFAFIIINNNDK